MNECRNCIVRMGSGYRPFDSTPINASQLLVMATPRSPMSVRSSAHSVGTPAISSQSQQSMKHSTPLSLPRGDMGRLRTNSAAMLNFAPPGTPNSFAPETPRSTFRFDINCYPFHIIWTHLIASNLISSYIYLPFNVRYDSFFIFLSSRRSNIGTPLDDDSTAPNDYSTSNRISRRGERNEQEHLEEVHVDEESQQGLTGDGTRIWGTNINTETCISVFTNFIRNYTCNSDFEPFYMKQLHVIHRTENFVLNLNCGHMFDFSGAKRLYRQLQVDADVDFELIDHEWFYGIMINSWFIFIHL